MERALLHYFARDEAAARGYQSLTTIFELIDRPAEWRNSFFDQLDRPSDKAALGDFLERMTNDGLLEKHQSEKDYEAHYRASDQGIYESTIGFSALVAEDADDVTEDGGRQINSSSWTGIRRVTIDTRNAKVISSLIGQAIDALPQSDAGNQAVMQAAAYLKAARELVEAPEPPSVVIWDLLQKAAAIAGLLQIFGSIFSQAIS